MQCKPVTSLPAGEKWTFEIKFDGYRCVAAKRGTEVTLFRAARRYSLNRRFPNMVDILASCPLIAGGKGRGESAAVMYDSLLERSPSRSKLSHLEGALTTYWRTWLNRPPE